MGTEENRCFTFLFIILLLGASIHLLRSCDGVSWGMRRIEITNTGYDYPRWKDNETHFTVVGKVICPHEGDTPCLYAKLEVNSSIFESTEIELLVFSRSISINNFCTSITMSNNVSSGGDHIVNITGKWGNAIDNLTNELVSDSCRFSVPQYYSWEVGSTESVKVRAGNTVKVLFNTTNLGNGSDRPSIGIVNNDEFTDRGWDIQLSTTKPYIPSGRSMIIPLIIEIPEDEEPGTYEIDILYHSRTAENLGKISEAGTQTLTIKVLNNYKDEIISVSIIAGPIILLFVIILVLVQFKRKKERRSNE